MSLAELTTTVLSVDYLFGAATALAFRKQVSGLFSKVLGNAGDTAENDDSKPLNGS